MHFWQSLTALGDTGVMLPVAAVIALWLSSAHRLRLAGWWCATVAAVGLSVAASKLLFMGWCLGLRSVDFTGISGHSAMAALMLPVLADLAQRSLHARADRRILPIGEILAVLVGMSRLAIHVHSVSEVAAGLLLGLSASHLFLRAAHRSQGVAVSARMIAGSALLLPGLLLLQPAPTQYLLERIAVLISDHRTAFTRHAESCEPQQWQVRQDMPAAMMPGAVPPDGSGAARTSAR